MVSQTLLAYYLQTVGALYWDTHPNANYIDRGQDCADPILPSVGSRTSATNYIRSQTCQISANPPASFGCASIAAVPTAKPSSAPSPRPSMKPQTTTYTTQSCKGVLQHCVIDSDCCSNRCVYTVCRAGTNEFQTRTSLALRDNRGGAAGRAYNNGQH